MTRNQPQDEFYIGYAKIPPRQWRFLKRLLPILVICYLILALVIPSWHFEQYNLGQSSKRQDFTGLLLAEPTPHLLVPRTGNSEPNNAFSLYLLSAGNKAAPKPAIMKHAGQWVKLNGLPFHRNQFTILVARKAEPIEAAPEGEQTLAVTSKAPPEPIPLGEYALEGEIIDSKCYSGVMKPGRTKTHKDCAVRCISGGVPPVFRVQNRQGDILYFLLADLEGKAVNDRILEYVADSLKITGEVFQYGDAFMIKADPQTYERT